MFSMKMLQQGAAAALLAILAIYGLSGMVNINPGEVGIQIKKIGEGRGMQDETLGTGLFWVEPVTYDVEVYDARSRQYQDGLQDMASQTKDGQPIQVDLSMEIRLVASNVPGLHESVGKDYFDQVVFPAVRSGVRNVTTTKLSDEIYTGAGRMAVQNSLQKLLDDKLLERGIVVMVNLRDIEFTNKSFVATLEEKAKAAQKVLIAERNAEAAEHKAKQMENLAEGEKQKRIKAAEADREERRLKGEGDRLEKEETAKGNLALAQSEAEGMRLRREALAGKGGSELVSIAWAENLGPNVKVYGIPTGSPGTSSLMDINGLIGGAFKGAVPTK